ncbi:hypothetical protein KIPB_000266 [Kipferlia bialata]|uniref:EGF-like domain-containing protein n=1 Tax=Kipferlia bialata TaxID=797122 RepID=A0A9K3CNJ0_9EUKA|nr:hypothetical protein KIPB_000266 [Kipferlia bialata]|eukprot:g266.t1
MHYSIPHPSYGNLATATASSSGVEAFLDTSTYVALSLPTGASVFSATITMATPGTHTLSIKVGTTTITLDPAISVTAVAPEITHIAVSPVFTSGAVSDPADSVSLFDMWGTPVTLDNGMTLTYGLDAFAFLHDGGDELVSDVDMDTPGLYQVASPTLVGTETTSIATGVMFSPTSVTGAVPSGIAADVSTASATGAAGTTSVNASVSLEDSIGASLSAYDTSAVRLRLVGEEATQWYAASMMSSGQYQVSLTLPSIAGAYTYEVSVGSSIITATGDMTVTAAATDGAASTLSVLNATVQPRDTVRVYFDARDAFGNPAVETTFSASISGCGESKTVILSKDADTGLFYVSTSLVPVCVYSVTVPSVTASLVPTTALTVVAGDVHVADQDYTTITTLAATAGEAFTLSAKVVDVDSNVISATVTVTLSDYLDAYDDPVTFTLTLSSGIYSVAVPAETLTAAGEYTAVLSVDGVDVSGTWGKLVVSPAAPAYSAGDTSLSYIVNVIDHMACTATTLSVYVRDEYGNSIPDASSVVVTVVSNNASAPITGPYTLSPTGSGLYTSTTTTFSDFGTVGSYTLSAAVSGLTPTMPATVSVVVGSRDNDNSGIVAIPGTHDPDTTLSQSVYLEDSCHNPISSVTDGILGIKVYNSNNDLEDTVGVTYSSAGTYTGTATSSKVVATDTYNLKVTMGLAEMTWGSTTLSVGYGAPRNSGDSLLSETGLSSHVAGQTLALSAHLVDQWGNDITGLAADTVSVTIVGPTGYTGAETLGLVYDAGGVFEATAPSSMFQTAGAYTLNLKVESLEMTPTRTLTVSPAAPAYMTGSTLSSHLLDVTDHVACDTTTLSAYLRDIYQNPITTSSVLVTVAAHDGNATLPGPYTLVHSADGLYTLTTSTASDFGVVGTYTLSAYDEDGTIAMSGTVTVVHGAIDTSASGVEAVSGTHNPDDALSLSLSLVDSCQNHITDATDLGIKVWLDSDSTVTSTLTLTHAGSGVYTGDVTSGDVVLTGAYTARPTVAGDAQTYGSTSVNVGYGAPRDTGASLLSASGLSSHIAGQVLTLEAHLVDQWGNDITGYPADTVSVEVTGPTGYTGATSVTLVYDTNGVFKATAPDSLSDEAGEYTLKLKVNDVILSAGQTLTVTESAMVVDSTHTRITPVTLEAGMLGTIEAYVVDEYMNPLPSTSVYVVIEKTDPPADFVNPSPIQMSLSGDVYQAYIYADSITLAGAYTLKLKVDDSVITGAASTLTVTPSYPVYSAGDTTLSHLLDVTDHVACDTTTLSAYLRDLFHNPITDSAVTVTVTANDANVAITGPYTLQHSADGLYTLTTSSSDFGTVGTYTLSATDTSQLVTMPASVTAVHGAVSSASAVTAVSGTHNPDATLELSLSLEDTCQNPVMDASDVAINVYNGATLTSVVTTTHSSGGTYTGTATAGDVVATGDYTLKLDIDGTEQTFGSTTLSVGVGAVSSDTSSITSPTLSSHVAGAALSLSATLKDQWSNPVTTGTVKAYARAFPASYTGATLVSLTHTSQGVYTGTVAANSATDFVIAGDYTLLPQHDDVVVESPSTLVVVAGEMYVDGTDTYTHIVSVSHPACSTLALTAIVTDGYGNGIGGIDSVVVSVVPPDGSDSIGPFTLSPSASTLGEYVYSTSTDFSDIGTYTLSMSVAGAPLTSLSGTVTVVTGGLSADNSSVSAFGVHDPDSSLPISVRVRDSCGNLNVSATPSVALVIASHPSNAAIPETEQVLTQDATQKDLYTADSTLFTIAGEYELRLRIDSELASSTVSLTVGTGAPSTNLWELDVPTSSVAAGEAFDVSTTLIDSHGNKISSEVQATMANGSTSISVALVYSGAGGVHTGTLSSTAVGNLVVGVSVYGAATTLTRTVTVVPADAAASECTLSVSSRSISAGEDVSLSLSLVDAYLNPISDASVSVTLTGCNRWWTVALDLVTGEDGVYAGTADDLTLACSSGLSISIAVDGEELEDVSGATTPVVVWPGALKSFGFAPLAQYQAGTTYTLSATFEDEYDNAVTVESPTIEYTGCALTQAASIALSYDGTAYTNTDTVFVYACSEFTGVLVSGSGSSRVEHTTSTFEVTTGPVDYSASSVSTMMSGTTGVADAFVAGEDIVVRVTLVDTQLNRITSSPVTLSYSMCDASVVDVTMSLIETSGVYQSTIQRTDACTQATSLSAAVSGSTNGSTSLSITVSPASPSAAESTLTVPSSSVSAGDDTTVSLSLLDEYSNIVTDAASVTVSVTSDDGTLVSELPLTLVGVGATTYTGVLSMTLSGEYTLSVSGTDLPSLSTPISVSSGAIVPAHSVLTVTDMSSAAMTVLYVGRDQYMNTCTVATPPVALSGSVVWTQVGTETVYNGVYDLSGVSHSVSLELSVAGETLPSVDVPVYTESSTCLECEGETSLCYDSGSGDAACLCPPSLSGSSCATPTYTSSPLAYAYAPSAVYLPESVTEVYPFLEMPLLPSLPSAAYLSSDMHSAAVYSVALEAGTQGTLTVDSGSLPSGCTVGTSPMSIACPLSGNTMASALQHVQMAVTSASPFAEEVSLSATVSWALDTVEYSTEAVTRSVMSSGIDTALTSLTFGQDVVPGSTLSSGSLVLQYHDGTPYSTSLAVSLRCASSADALSASPSTLSLTQSATAGTYDVASGSVTVGYDDVEVVCVAVIGSDTSPNTLSTYVQAAEPDVARTLVTYVPSLLTTSTSLSVRAVLRDASFIPVYDSSHTVTVSLGNSSLGSLSYSETSSGVGVFHGTLSFLGDMTLTANTAVDLVLSVDGEAGPALPVYVYAASSECGISCAGLCVDSAVSESALCLEDTTASVTGLYAFPQSLSSVELVHGQAVSPFVSSGPMLTSLVDSVSRSEVRSASATVAVTGYRATLFDTSAVDSTAFTVADTYTSSSHTLTLSGTPETVGYALSKVVVTPSVQSPLGGTETLTVSFESNGYSVSTTLTVVTPSLDTASLSLTLTADPAPGDSIGASLDMVYATSSADVFSTLFDVSLLCGQSETDMTYTDASTNWTTVSDLVVPTDSASLQCTVYVGGYAVLEVEQQMVAGEVDYSMSVANVTPNADGTVSLSLYLRDSYGNVANDNDLSVLVQYGVYASAMTYSQDTATTGHYEASLALQSTAASASVLVDGAVVASAGPLPSGPVCSDLDCGAYGVCVTDSGVSVCSVSLTHSSVLTPFAESVALLPVMSSAASLLESGFRKDNWTLLVTADSGSLALDSSDASFPASCSVSSSTTSSSVGVTCDAPGLIAVGQLLSFSPECSALSGCSSDIQFSVRSEYYASLSQTSSMQVVTSGLDSAVLSMDSVTAGTAIEGASLSLLYADGTPVTAFSPSLSCAGIDGVGTMTYESLTSTYSLEANSMTAPSTAGSYTCSALVDGQTVATATLTVTALPASASLTSVYADTLIGQAGDTISLTVTARDSLLNPVCAGDIQSLVDSVVTTHTCDTQTTSYSVDVTIPSSAEAGDTTGVSVVVLGETVLSVYVTAVTASATCPQCDASATCAQTYSGDSACVCAPGSTGGACSKTDSSSPFTTPKVAPFVTQDRQSASLDALPVLSLMPAVSNPSFTSASIPPSTSLGVYTDAQRWDRLKVRCPSSSVAVVASLPDALSDYAVTSTSSNVAVVSASHGLLGVAARAVTCTFPDTDPADAPKAYSVQTTLSYAYQYTTATSPSPAVPTVYTDLSSESLSVVVTHTPAVSADDSVFSIPSSSVVGGIVSASVSLYDEYGIAVTEPISDAVSLSCPSACAVMSTSGGVLSKDTSSTTSNVYSIALTFTGECSGECNAYIGSEVAGSAVSVDVVNASYVVANTDVTLGPLAIFADGSVSASVQLMDEDNSPTASDSAAVQLCVGTLCQTMPVSEGVYSLTVSGADLDSVSSRGTFTTLDMYITIDGATASYVRKLTVLQPVAGNSSTVCTAGSGYYQSRALVLEGDDSATTISKEACLADASPAGFTTPVLAHLITMQETLSPLTYAQLDSTVYGADTSISLSVSCVSGTLSLDGTHSGVDVVVGNSHTINLTGTVQDVYTAGYNLLYTPSVLTGPLDTDSDTITLLLGTGATTALAVDVIFAAPALDYDAISLVVPATSVAGDSVNVQMTVFSEDGATFTYPSVLDVSMSVDGVSATVDYAAGVYSTSATLTAAGTVGITVSVTELKEGVEWSQTSYVSVQAGAHNSAHSLYWLDTYAVAPSSSVAVSVQLRDQFDNVVSSTSTSAVLTLTSPESVTLVDEASTGLSVGTFTAGALSGVTQEVSVTVDGTTLPSLFLRVVETSASCASCASATGTCVSAEGSFSASCVCDMGYAGAACGSLVSESAVGFTDVVSGLSMDREDSLFPVSVMPVGVSASIASDTLYMADTPLVLSVCAQAGDLSIDASTTGLVSSDSSVSGCLSVTATLANMPSVAAAVSYTSTVLSTVYADTFDRIDLSLSSAAGVTLGVAKVPLEVLFSVPPLDTSSTVLSLNPVSAGDALTGTVSLLDTANAAYIYDSFVDVAVTCTHESVTGSVSADVSYVYAAEVWFMSVPGFTVAGDVTCVVDLNGSTTGVSETVAVSPVDVSATTLSSARAYTVLDEDLVLYASVSDVYGNTISDSSLVFSVSMSDGAEFTHSVGAYDSASGTFPVTVSASAHPTQVAKYSPVTVTVQVTNADATISASDSLYVSVYDAPLSYKSCVHGGSVGVESETDSSALCMCDAGYSGPSCAVEHGFPLQLVGVPSVVDAAPFNSLRPFRSATLAMKEGADADMTVSLTSSCVSGSYASVAMSVSLSEAVSVTYPDAHSVTVTGPLAQVLLAADTLVYTPSAATSYPSADTLTYSVGTTSAVAYSFSTVYTERWTTVTASATPATMQPIALAANSGSVFTRDLDFDVSLNDVTSLHVTAALSLTSLPSTASCSLHLGYGSVSEAGDRVGTPATLDAVSAADAADLSLSVSCVADGTVDAEYSGHVTYCLADASALSTGHSALLGSGMPAYTQYVAGDYSGQVESYGTVVFCNRVSVGVADYPVVSVSDAVSTPEDTSVTMGFVEIEHLPLYPEAQTDTLSLSLSSLHGSFTEDAACAGPHLSVLSLSAAGPSALNALLSECCYIPDADFFGSEYLYATVSCPSRDLVTQTTIPMDVVSVPDAPVLSVPSAQYMPLGSTLYAMPSVSSVESTSLTVTLSIPSTVTDSDGVEVPSLSIDTVCVYADGCTGTAAVKASSTEFTFTGYPTALTEALSHLGIKVHAPLAAVSDAEVSSVKIEVPVSVTDTNGLSDETTVTVYLTPSASALTVSDDLTHFTGTISSVSFAETGSFPCSSLFDTATASSFGTGAQCVVKTSSDVYGTGSTLTVFFGSSLTFLPGTDVLSLLSGLSVQAQTATGEASAPCALGDGLSFDVSSPDNPPTPVAVITGPSSVYKDASVTLSGQESDSVGTFSRALVYEWTITNSGNPNLSPFTEDIDLSGASLSFNAAAVLSPGNDYLITLTVTSVLGYSSSTSKILSVSGSIAPTLSMEQGNTQSVTLGDAIALRVRAEHPTVSQAGTISFVWTCTEGPDCAGLADTFAAFTRPYAVIPALSFGENTQHTVTVSGSYPSTDTEAVSGTTSVLIDTPYASPSACVSTASVVVNSVLPLTLSSCSEHFDTLEWTLPSSWAVTSMETDGSQVVLDVSGATPSDYSVSLRATRTLEGQEYTSDATTTITVVSTALPLVSVTHTPSVVVVSSQVSLSGVASSSTGDDIVYLWQQTAGPNLDLTDEDVVLSETLTTPNLVLASDVLLPLTEYAFSLTVADENGISSSTETFTTHSGPISGSLTVVTDSDSTTSDMYHDDRVALSTSGWVAISNMSPLTYSFTGRLEGETSTSTLQARSSARSVSALIPLVGDVYIGVWVYDAIGASTFYESATSISVAIRPGTDTASYIASLSSDINTANETGDTDVSIALLNASISYLSASETDTSALSAVASSLLALPADDLVSSSSVQTASAQTLSAVAGSVSSMSNEEADSLGELLGTMAGTANTDSSFVSASLSTADSLYDKVSSEFAASTDGSVMSLAKQEGLDMSLLSLAQRVGVRVLSSIEQVATNVAASLVNGQRAVTGAGSSVNFGAQAISTVTESAIGFLDGAANFSLPSGFGDAVGSTTGGDMYVSMVTMDTPPMGGNSTTFYSSMASISVSDDDGSLDVSDLADPVGITIPLDSIPDLDSLLSLNATLLVKAWNGTDWSEEGISTYGWDNTTAYLTAYTQHFTSFTSFFHQFGIDVNVIDPEDIPDLLSTIDDNMAPVMLLGGCISVYVGLMIALNYASVSDRRFKKLSNNVFRRDQAQRLSPFHSNHMSEGMFGPTCDDDGWAFNQPLPPLSVSGTPAVPTSTLGGRLHTPKALGSPVLPAVGGFSHSGVHTPSEPLSPLAPLQAPSNPLAAKGMTSALSYERLPALSANHTDMAHRMVAKLRAQRLGGSPSKSPSIMSGLSPVAQQSSLPALPALSPLQRNSNTSGSPTSSNDTNASMLARQMIERMQEAAARTANKQKMGRAFVLPPVPINGLQAPVTPSTPSGATTPGLAQSKSLLDLVSPSTKGKGKARKDKNQKLNEALRSALQGEMTESETDEGHTPEASDEQSLDRDTFNTPYANRNTGGRVTPALSSHVGSPSISRLDLTEIKTSKAIAKQVKLYENNKEETFTKRFLYDMFVTSLREHDWLSLIFHKSKSNMTGPRRLTCLMVFLFGLFFASALFFRADCQEGYANTGQEGLTVDDVVCEEYGWKQTLIIGVVTAFIATPPTTFFKYLFAHTRPIGKRVPGSDRTLTKRANLDGKSFFNRIVLRVLSKEWSYHYAYIWYGMAFTYLLVLMGMILLYALKFASTVGKNWMISNLTGILQDALINDPIKLLVQVLLSLKLASLSFAPELFATLQDFGIL